MHNVPSDWLANGGQIMLKNIESVKSLSLRWAADSSGEQELLCRIHNLHSCFECVTDTMELGYLETLLVAYLLTAFCEILLWDAPLQSTIFHLVHLIYT
jgi:hypothetical protein